MRGLLKELGLIAIGLAAGLLLFVASGSVWYPTSLFGGGWWGWPYPWRVYGTELGEYVLYGLYPGAVLQPGFDYDLVFWVATSLIVVEIAFHAVAFALRRMNMRTITNSRKGETSIPSRESRGYHRLESRASG
jgi:hypothetical protein